MTATELQEFSSRMIASSVSVARCVDILNDTHERTDTTRAAARILDKIEDQLRNIRDNLFLEQA